VASPNGELSLNFNLKEGTPTYSVDFKGKPVILPSALGFAVAGRPVGFRVRLAECQPVSKG
jgi:hypothetical protein